MAIHRKHDKICNNVQAGWQGAVPVRSFWWLPDALRQLPLAQQEIILKYFILVYKIKISIKKTELIELSLLGKFYIGPRMVLGYWIFIFKPCYSLEDAVPRC